MYYSPNDNCCALYTANNGPVSVQFYYDYYVDLFNYGYDEISEMIDLDIPDFKEGLSFNEYLYTCLYTYKQNPYIFEEDKEILDEICKRFQERVEYVSFIDDIFMKNYRMTSEEFVEFEINKELFDVLRENMNLNYSTNERIVYYYFKLCFLLEPDLIYNFCNLISSSKDSDSFQKSPNRLGDINVLNNQASCFEFDAIMSKLIQMEGGHVALNPYFGNSSHVFTYSVVNRCVMVFDAYEAPLESGDNIRDIVYIKAGKNYGGIICNSKAIAQDGYLRNSFIDKIYNDVKNEFKWYFEKKKFSKESLDYCYGVIEELDIDEYYKYKLKDYFVKFNNYGFGGVAYFSNVINDKIIEEEDKDRINLVGVCSNFESYGLNIVVSVKQDNEEMIYFVFGEDDNIRIFNRDEMHSLVGENKVIINCRQHYDDINGNISISNSYMLIPGIDESLQIQMNGVAKREVVPLAYKQLYKDSMIGTTKVYKKTFDELN